MHVYNWGHVRGQALVCLLAITSNGACGGWRRSCSRSRTGRRRGCK